MIPLARKAILKVIPPQVIQCFKSIRTRAKRALAAVSPARAAAERHALELQKSRAAEENVRGLRWRAVESEFFAGEKFGYLRKAPTRGSVLAKNKRLVLIECSNLTCHPYKEIRTGIQELEYQVLRTLVLHRSEISKRFPDVDVRPLLTLPSGIAYADVTPAWLLDRLTSEWGSIDAIIPDSSTPWAVHFQSLSRLAHVRSAFGPECRVSVTLHDLGPVRYPDYAAPGVAQWFRNEYLSGIAETADLVLCDSKFTAREFIDSPWAKSVPSIGYLRLAPSLEYNPAPSRRLLEKLGLSAGEYFVYLGSLEPRKNFAGMKDGFEEFRKANPSSRVRFVWVGGTGWNNYSIERSDWVCTGYLEETEMRDLIQQSCGLVMISVYEGFGIPIAQARSLGVPIITHFGSSLPEASEGEAVFVDPGDSSSIADGFKRAQGQALDPTVLKRTKWNWEDYVFRLIEMISDSARFPTNRTRG